MRATVLHGVHDVRLEQVPDPTVQPPTDALVRVVAACGCGSDLRPTGGSARRRGPGGSGTSSSAWSRRPDGTPAVAPGSPDDEPLPGVLTCGDVMGTGHHAEAYAAMDERRAVTAMVRP